MELEVFFSKLIINHNKSLLADTQHIFTDDSQQQQPQQRPLEQQNAMQQQLTLQQIQLQQLQVALGPGGRGRGRGCGYRGSNFDPQFNPYPY
jgi:hypothetical protein